VSAVEEFAAPEVKSSIKIATTAKGDPQVTVTIREGVDADEITRLRTLAVDAYKQTRSAVA
jgi:hypothetical protein